MITDVIKLKNRYAEYDNVLSTMVPKFTYFEGLDEVDWYGRDVAVSPFVDGLFHRYKLCEQYGDKCIERIFLCNEDLDFNKKWWTAENKVYPLQVKIFDRKDPIIGNTLKYVNGLTEYLEEYSDGEIVVPTVLSRYPVHNPDLILDSAYNVIIPSLDIDLLSDHFSFNPIINIDGIDNWSDSENTVDSVVKSVDINTVRMQHGSNILDMDEKPFDPEDCMVNTDPIQHYHSTYRLLMLLNDLAVTDIKITGDRSGNIEVELTDRYSGVGDCKKFHTYNLAVERITAAVKCWMLEALKHDPWVRFTIEKFWSEEIYITVYMGCEGRSSLIDTQSYVDLPTLLLGTVGLT